MILRNYILSTLLILLLNTMSFAQYSADAFVAIACVGDSTKLKVQSEGKLLGWYADNVDQVISNSNDATTLWVKPLTTTIYIAEVVFREEMVVNGDFEMGNTHFESDYPFVTSLQKFNEYTITVNSGLHAPGYTAFTDHTTGAGNMMIIDGDTNQTVFYRIYLDVEKDLEYQFSVWATNIHREFIKEEPDTSQNKSAWIEFLIDGVVIGDFHLPTKVEWTAYNQSWIASANKTIKLEFRNKVTTVKGNDFAIDDVSFLKPITAKSSVTVKPCIQDDVFSPIDNGILDTYRIEGTGIAKIYDVSGTLIKELTLPATWDGTNQSGVLASGGYYVIIFEDNSYKRVTIVR